MNEKIRHHFGDGPVVWVPAWGISKLRKRAGKFAGAILGEARWYDDWYARVLSPETARKLADLGVNLVILPFSIGGSASVENQERDDFERMTGHLHACGIVSLPYLQYQNILQEYHRLDDTVWAEGLDGERTGFAYWRRTVCQGSEDFLGYMKGLIDDAIRRGADGIWIDNTYKKPCRCPLCLERFRGFLGRNHAGLLDELHLPDFDRIELPPARFNTLTAYAHDPIVQAYIEFLCDLNTSIHRTLKSHMEAQSSLALYASNPGLYRGLAYGERGMDLYALLRLHDLMYLENKLFPHAANGAGEGNYHGFVCCEALGAVGIPGAWKPHVDFDSTRTGAGKGLPECGGEVEAILYEAAAFNGSPGLFWAVRSRSHDDAANPEELRQMQMDRAELFEPAREAIRFLRTLPAGSRHNAAEVAVLYHRASHDLNHAQTAASIHAAECLLHGARIPYDLVFSEDWAALDRFSVVLCPDVKLLSDADAQALRAYVAGGGRLMVIGPLGVHDERNRVRDEAALCDVTGVSAFGAEPWTLGEFGEGHTATLMRPGLSGEPIPNLFPAATLTWPNWRREGSRVIEGVDALLPRGRQIRVEGEGAWGVSLSRLDGGGCLAQVVRYDADAKAQCLSVRLRADICADGTPRCFRPGAAPVELTSRSEGGYRVSALDGVTRFAALSVS